MKKMVIVVLVCIVCSLCQATEIMNDGFEAADTLEGNGWDTTLSNWNISTGNYGNPSHYIWGGGSGGAGDNDPTIVSGVVSKDTGYAIQSGDVIDLVFDIRDLSSDIENDASFIAKLYYLDGVTQVDLGSAEYSDAAVLFGWHDGMGALTVNATEGAIGNNLFVSFTGTGGDGQSAQRLGIDNVIISQVPEPATTLLFGLGSLAALKCKRA